jgi:hypothetical protein
MKSSIHLVTAFACVALISGTPAAAQEARMTPEINKAASAGLEQALRVIQESNNPSLLGLRSTDEAESARLGVPMYVGTLSFDKLTEYQPEARFEDFLAGPTRSVVPVEVNGEVRAWISLVQEGQQWQLTGFGENTTATSVDQAVRAVRAVREREVRLIHVPAFNLHLVSFVGEEGARLIPVGPTTIAEMKSGVALPADEVLKRLAEHARRTDAEYGDQIRARRVVD